MSSVYERFLERLYAYRKEQDLSQTAMGDYLGVSQSHYSKLEKNKKWITGTEMERLGKRVDDIDYFITGEPTTRTVLDELLEACPEECKADLLQLMVWTVQQGVYISGDSDRGEAPDYVKEIEFLRYKNFAHISDKSVWYQVRKANDLTQEEMAEKLNTYSKGYREIEQGKKKANGEVLASLYENFGYPPSLILEEDVKNLRSLNRIWDSFDEELKRELEGFIREGLRLCQKRQ